MASLQDNMQEKPVVEKTKKKGKFWRVLGWFFLVCIAFELILRLFGYGNYTIYRPDEKLLWIPEPGRTVTIDNHLPITINHQGLRYATDLTAKQKGEFRIIAFGDSATQGWGVDDDSTYSADLGRLLNKTPCAGEHFQVVSAGVNAYPNALVGEKLKEVVEDDTYSPDIVIRAYSFNSNFEKLPKLQGQERKNFLRRVEFKAVVRRSAIYNFVIEDLLRRAVYYKVRHLLLAGTLATVGGMDALDMPAFNASLQQSLDLTKAHHEQLVFLVMASQGQPDNDLHPFQKAMLEFAAANNIPTINMIQGMHGKDPSAMFMDIVHPTKAGHEVIAEQLYGLVRGLPVYTEACQAGGQSVANSAASAPSGATATR